ncbi:acetyl/propionyl/methylcrotonyl-CoA carboxylase subunit alpha [Rhabdothermincola sp.]|uniref:acetyl/propionyl/methylcrotonyl-CoA carboxylase subunit alpha n=1 Tax=Rhabdothermincola sp. TaxID=2820405 RepID=UPI002FE0B2C9
MSRIDTLLIANRGEIAVRIIRAARGLGMRTVAVYAEPDRDALHVRAADVAVPLGGSSAAESYLDVDKILAAAERTGASAVHPGYGFLAERAPAAAAVESAGLIWVGPHVEAIRLMGDKLEAKRVATSVGVPTLPSAELTGDTPFVLHEQAAAVGYPLLVKAAAGGGGKGMRLVETPNALAGAVATARREAQASFADQRVFAERWLASPRHIEVQVVADRHGHVAHLGERECSIQRRHQKLIEEAPSPAVDPALRRRLGEAACALARAIGYDSVGTVELLVDPDTGEFFFLEMNTRLQVEHPVTEEVTGIDLVVLQLRAAEGEPVARDLPDAAAEGHAIEARVYAERPGADWLPTFGTLHRFRCPDELVRCDAGVDDGSEISTFYDPLLAKVIAHGATRDEAIGRLVRALTTMQIHGVETNRDHLVAVLEDADFRAGRTPTSYVEDHPLLLDASPGKPVRTAHAIAATLVGRHRRRLADEHWGHASGGWRNVDRDHREVVAFATGGATLEITYRVRADGSFTATVGDETLEGRLLEVSADRVRMEIGAVMVTCAVNQVGPRIWVNSPAGQTELIELPRFPEKRTASAASGPTAPVPGRVVRVEVEVGSTVTAGQTLVVLEAMKVEHRIAATADGRVAEILVDEGANVDAHQLLVRVEEQP